MSHDHKPDLAEEKDRITKAGGQVVGGRVNGNLNLSRALGDLEYKSNKDFAQDKQLIISKPDIQKHSLKGVQHIILGCDGLFERRSNQDIYDSILAGGNDLKKTGENLLDEILAKTSEGNGITIQGITVWIT